MKLSFDWLTRFVPHGRSAADVRDLLTAHVATVEGFEPLLAGLAPFVVARVVETEKIPDTKLSFNKVDDGSGELLEVVCGAPNVVAGNKYPFARTGTVMPAGLKIEKRKIRGFTSNGMLCSPRELGLGEDHDGILTLDTDAAPGTPLLDVLPPGDVRLELDVLPNRPDLLSHLGVAREISALTGVPLAGPPELADLPALPERVATGERESAAGGVSVRVEDAEGCPRYTAAVITDVTVGPSPAWLKACIEAVGARSINNIVDATNYLLHGFGQPMHAFDLERLGGKAIVVRRAKAGEQLTTLDGTARKLTPEMLVIADAERPVALAGVMGGKDSEVTESTTNIVLEVASFDARRVRLTRKGVGLSTDASYRYERGIDDAKLSEALALGAALIAQVSGGHVEAMLHVGHPPEERAPVALRPEKVARILGDDISREETVGLLASVGFVIARDDGVLQVIPPSWRHDVQRDVDLIEEVARLRGFDRLPDALQGARPGTVRDHPMWSAYVRVREALVAAGLHELRPLPFTAGREGASLVRVENPLAEDEPFLRDTVLDTLARRAEYNLNRMQGNLRLFEVGHVFVPREPGALPREELRAALLVMGERRPPHFTEAQPPRFDHWDVKALAATLATAAFPGTLVALEPRPEQGPVLWTVLVDGVSRGTVQRVALDAPVWASPAFGVELTLALMPSNPVADRGSNAWSAAGAASLGASAARPEPRRFTPIPAMPAAEFDLALLVPEALPAVAVEGVLRRTGGELLERCVLFDEFRGKGLPDGMRSLAWRLTFRHPERTLRDKELEGRRAQLLKTLEAELGVTARTA